MTKKYRAVKYMGDDEFSWAIFLAKDIKGYRSPICEWISPKPLYSGLCMSEKKYYIKQLEEADKKNEN